MKLTSFRLDRTIFALFIVGWIIFFAVTGNNKLAHAATNPSGLTGKYGCMFNKNINGYVNYYNTATTAVQAVTFADYSNNTSSGVLSIVKDFNTTTADTYYEIFNSTFTEEAVPGVQSVFENKHVLTFNDGTKDSMTMLNVVVNSGNTILASQVPNDNDNNEPNWSGVCQKI